MCPYYLIIHIPCEKRKEKYENQKNVKSCCGSCYCCFGGRMLD